jgi:lipopolysaccharide/colanic/teichoic acid biosynthesis glycosyltransferase
MSGMSGIENKRIPAGGFYARFGKRILDVFVAAVALVFAAPILTICAVAIYVDSRGPIFYRQWRAGRNGEPFRIIKLRTMVCGADTQGLRITASGDPRITRVGRILRGAKLDEVPQFLNVIHGKMSIVGPRPELPEYISKYTLADRTILGVRPGVTGPASLWYIDEEKVLASAGDREEFYVNHLMQHKLQLDLGYCRAISLRNDVRIMLRTAAALLAVFARFAKKSSPGAHDFTVQAESPSAAVTIACRSATANATESANSFTSTPKNNTPISV